MTKNPTFSGIEGSQEMASTRSGMKTKQFMLITFLMVVATFLVALATFLTVFFDEDAVPVPVPVPTPTLPPTDPPVVETAAPTQFPTSTPTLSPTITAPTEFPTFIDTPFPTAAPTGFPTPSPTETCNITLGEEFRNGDNYIGVIFTGCPTDSAFVAFEEAANRWSTIITENKITPTEFGVDFNVNDVCGFLQPFEISGFEFIDHLVIIAETVEIDGPGSVLGAAGNCVRDVNEFPVFGGMRFDLADLDNLEAAGALKDVILHEMGHVLGISRFHFRRVKQGGGPVGDAEDLMDDPVFDPITGEPSYGNLPKFTGEVTAEAMSELSGAPETFVHLEDGFNALNEPIFNFAVNSGAGSIDSHWDKVEFDNELMTFALNFADTERPLSIISVSSLFDMGYSVDFTQADPYTLPGNRTQAEKKLKDMEAGEAQFVSLENDIPEGWSPEDVISVEELLEKLRRKHG